MAMHLNHNYQHPDSNSLGTCDAIQLLNLLSNSTNPSESSLL